MIAMNLPTPTATRYCAAALIAVALLVLGGCASPRNKAPVEDRGARTAAATVAPAVPVVDSKIGRASCRERV